MVTLWNGKTGMRVTLKYLIRNTDENLCVTIYRAEDGLTLGEWFVIVVQGDNVLATETYWFHDLRDALALTKIAVFIEENKKVGDNAWTEVEPNYSSTKYTRAELTKSPTETG